tara:strand:- start:333 stop:656 length:324 start_codon:yes stop_codon:yes gene_type:complete
MKQFRNRGKLVYIYSYSGNSTIGIGVPERYKLQGSRGLYLEQERKAHIVFCPAVNRILTFRRGEFAFTKRIGYDNARKNNRREREIKAREQSAQKEDRRIKNRSRKP